MTTTQSGSTGQAGPQTPHGHTTPRLGDGIDAELRHLIPEGICRTFRVMPYAVLDGSVLVAAADADDEITLSVVEERIDQPVLLVRHTAIEIIGAIDETYPPVETEVETAEARRARTQMAQMLTRSGLITPEQLQKATLELIQKITPTVVARG